MVTFGRRTAALGIVAVAAGLARAGAQPNAKPANDLPNPYVTVTAWARMPEGRVWGSTSAVDIDLDGKSVWVFERCSRNTCANSDLPAILKFDEQGNLVHSFGAGVFLSPHGIDVDHEGNVWVADCSCTGMRQSVDSAGAPAPRGHQVFKFSPEGKLLLTLGTPGGSKEPGYFRQPNDVLVAPNGNIFVAEGHSSADTATARILKFSAAGKFIKAWGKKGSGRGELDQPHALAMDSRGRLFVGDRSNNRIQIFDQEGNFLEEWTQFSRPSGIYIDRHDTIYVADSESGSVARARTDWKRGIRVGSARDGVVTAFIPDPDEKATGTSAAEGVAVDAAGNIYGAEVGPRALKKYVKR
ncbi:MAG: peptidyl-alpha-hydroxyglycine alpha-amidating lyase family protein [Gemmatimonadaceae bacterium]